MSASQSRRGSREFAASENNHGSTGSSKRNSMKSSISNISLNQNQDPKEGGANPNVSAVTASESTAPNANSGNTKYGISAAALQELHEIFSLVDRDGGGTISPEELRQLMLTLGLKTTQAELQVMVQEIDTNQDGEIDFDEFVTAMSRKVNTSVPKDKLLWAFKALETQSLRDRDMLHRVAPDEFSAGNAGDNELDSNNNPVSKISKDSGPHFTAKTRGTIPMEFLIRSLSNYGDKSLTREEIEDIFEQIAPGIGGDEQFDYARYIDVMFTSSY